MRFLFSWRDRQFIRFLFVGAMNTAFGYGLFLGFLKLGLHQEIALLMSTMVGIAFNFQTMGRLVFASSNQRLFFRFIGVYGVVYIVNVMGLDKLERFGLKTPVAAAILVLPMAVLAFILNKRLVFGRMNA